MKRDVALITGCNGFVGRYLAKELNSRNFIVHGFDLQENCVYEEITYHRINLLDSEAITSLFVNLQPNFVFHLAAVANPRHAKDQPYIAYQTNVLGTVSILEGCRQVNDCKVLLVGSSEEYKKTGNQKLLFTEDSPLEALSVYGSSKIAAELAAKTWISQYNVKAFFTRSFNHSGPGQAELYVLSDFAFQCAKIKLGLQPPLIRTGNIEIKLDFLDVRDVVKAYTDILQKGLPGEVYNVSSGNSISLRDCIDIMSEYLDIDHIVIEVDPSRIRPGEPASITGDSKKLKSQTSWKPLIKISQTLKDLLDYWITELEKKTDKAHF